MTLHSHPDETLGTYVLGLESNDERARVRTHLDACSVCRQEWHRLREIPALLARAVAVQAAWG